MNKVKKDFIKGFEKILKSEEFELKKFNKKKKRIQYWLLLILTIVISSIVAQFIFNPEYIIEIIGFVLDTITMIILFTIINSLDKQETILKLKIAIAKKNLNAIKS